MEHTAKVAVCEKVALLFCVCVQIGSISLQIIHSKQTAKVPLQALIPPHTVRFPTWSSKQLWKAARLSLSLSGCFHLDLAYF